MTCSDVGTGTVGGFSGFGAGLTSFSQLFCIAVVLCLRINYSLGKERVPFAVMFL